MKIKLIVVWSFRGERIYSKSFRYLFTRWPTFESMKVSHYEWAFTDCFEVVLMNDVATIAKAYRTQGRYDEL